MTLREMRAAYPAAFYPQDWFDGEAFMDRTARVVAWPSTVVRATWWRRWMTADWRYPYSAADLAWLWLNPAEPAVFTDIWQRYLWTCDTDSQGQRVYVGQNGKGLEIHRFIHLTDRFGVPV